MSRIGRLQLTLAILKPDLTKMPYSLEHVRSMILAKDFVVIRSLLTKMSVQRAQQFYAEHEGRFFYNRLVTYMSSGPCFVHILGRQKDAITEWRQLMGPTKVFKTRYECPDTVRGKFGLTDTRNSTHGSDSEETATREIDFFFPNFDVNKFYEEGGEETSFRLAKVNGTLKLDHVAFVHLRN